MRKIMNIISDIALVIAVIIFIIYMIKSFASGGLYFDLSTMIIFGICLIIFLFRENKRDALTDILEILDYIFDWF